MPDIGVIRKGPVYPAFGLDNFNQYIAPLGQAINQGNDSFEHVNPYIKDRTYLNQQISSRINAGVTGNIPVFDNLSLQHDADEKKQFEMNSHYQLEHLMRTAPHMFSDVGVNQRIFLQTGVIPQGWNANPAMSLPFEDKKRVRNTKTGTYDFHSQTNVPERRHPLVVKPHDIGMVYERGRDNRFTPITATPTPMWLAGEKSKHLTARPLGVQQNSMPKHHELEVYDRHSRHNKENGYKGMTMPIQAQVLRHSHKKPEVREEVEPAEPVELEEGKRLSGDLPISLKTHFKTGKNSVGVKGKIPAKWANEGNPNSLPRRIANINDAHDAEMISDEDKKTLLTFLLRHSIESGHLNIQDLTGQFNRKKWNVADDDAYSAALMEIQKARFERIADLLLKERKSPEAMRRKKEYDTKYEASPDRVKYREDLNRERHKRGMYGDHSHRDISHTEGGKLTVEDEHKNRARHFKDKGTLRPITKGIKQDLELLRNLMAGPMDEQDKSIAQALLTSLDDYHQEEDVESRKELMHPYPF